MSSITSIQGNQLFSATTSQSSATSVKANVVSDSQKTTANKDEALATSQDGDTLVISASGTALAQKTYTGQSAQSGAVSKDEGYTDATAEALSNAAASAGITEYSAVQNEMSNQSAIVSGSTSGSSSTSNLSNYSEAELKEMLQNGEITRAEYEAEMESRSTSSDDSEDDSNVTDSTQSNATES